MFFNGDTLLILIINNIHTNKKKTRSGEMVWNLKKPLNLFCEQNSILILYLKILAAFSQSKLLLCLYYFFL